MQVTNEASQSSSDDTKFLFSCHQTRSSKHNIGNVFVSLQDFCEHSERWPPLSELQLFMGEVGKSCVEVCKLSGKFCLCVIN